MIPWWGWALFVLLIIGIIAFIRYYVWKRMRRLLTSPVQVASTPVEEISRKEQETEQSETIVEQSSTVTEEKYKTNRLTEEECVELHRKLMAYVEKEKPYINSDLKMGDLASALDTSSHSLSYLLNQYLNQSYYDFINEYRVTQFKKW